MASVRRLAIPFNRRTIGPASVTPMPLKLSCRMASKTDPLASFLTKVAPTLSGIPSISVTHLATSSQLHCFYGAILSFCVQSGSSNCFTRAESLHSPKVNRFVAMIFPLKFSDTISSSSLKKNMRLLFSYLSRIRCSTRSLLEARRALCYSSIALLTLREFPFGKW